MAFPENFNEALRAVFQFGVDATEYRQRMIRARDDARQDIVAVLGPQATLRDAIQALKAALTASPLDQQLHRLAMLTRQRVGEMREAKNQMAAVKAEAANRRQAIATLADAQTQNTQAWQMLKAWANLATAEWPGIETEIDNEASAAEAENL